LACGIQVGCCFFALTGARLVLEARDFVFHPQLATFQLNDLEIVDRRMGVGFGYFRFQAAMPSFQFRKMRLYGHIGCLPELDRWRRLRATSAMVRAGPSSDAQFVTLECSQGCVWLPGKRQGANFREVLRFQHSSGDSRPGDGQNHIRTGSRSMGVATTLLLLAAPIEHRQARGLRGSPVRPRSGPR
jgi:hypothetical protein